jgi:hypothetical protein
VQLSFRLMQGKPHLRLSWEWEGHPLEPVPDSVLSFEAGQEKQILDRFNAAFGIDTAAMAFDVGSIIAIHSAGDVVRKRESVIEFLWGDAGFPSELMPVEVSGDIHDPDFDTLRNLERIDRLKVSMEFGLNSLVYHFVPEVANGSVALYHQGHGGKFNIGSSTIQAFLEQGYNVYALSMPLLGMNNKPVAQTEQFGKILLISSHEFMTFLIPEKGHAVKYFMEPVAATVNYAMQFEPHRVVMAGLSGGGWTTTLYAAIDPRIQNSFPVAGSLPVYLRSQDLMKSGTLGDFEQRVPGLYQRANYLELYLMGSFGANRSQLQILNEFDACCFGGRGFNSYESILKDRLRLLGEGRYGVYLDSSHRLHQVSPEAMNVILDYLEKPESVHNK